MPPWRIWRLLTRLARNGAKVQLILPGKCDVPGMRLVAHSYYRRFLRAGVEIYEYQPQILHAKLFVIDQVVYAGSANLDGRSMNINYELMVRLSNPAQVNEGKRIFTEILTHCLRIDLVTSRRSRTFLDRIKARLAHFILARLDPLMARRQLRGWKTTEKKERQAKKQRTSTGKP